jgi:type IV pilus assembly protein PilV
MLVTKIKLKSQSGASIIEVLITMIIVSIGLLGQAALVSQSFKASNTALLRSQATLLAYDMLERMRLNRTQALAGSYSINFTSSPPSGNSIQAIELRTWLASVAGLLPNGKAQIGVSGTGSVTITIQWSEATSGALNGAAAGSTQFVTQSIL